MAFKNKNCRETQRNLCNYFVHNTLYNCSKESLIIVGYQLASVRHMYVHFLLSIAFPTVVSKYREVMTNLTQQYVLQYHVQTLLTIFSFEPFCIFNSKTYGELEL
jgi:hypothetical protein